MTNSEPSRLDLIQALVESNARAIQELEAETAGNREFIVAIGRENREAIALLDEEIRSLSSRLDNQQ